MAFGDLNIIEASAERPETQRKWGMRLTERGFERQRRCNGIFYMGIGLFTDGPCSSEREPCEPENAEISNWRSREANNDKSGSHRSHGSHLDDTEKEKIPAPPLSGDISPKAENYTLRQRILAAVHAVGPGGLLLTDLVRAVQTPKGATPALVEQIVKSMLADGTIGKINGKLVEDR